MQGSSFITFSGTQGVLPGVLRVVSALLILLVISALVGGGLTYWAGAGFLAGAKSLAFIETILFGVVFALGGFTPSFGDR